MDGSLDFSRRQLEAVLAVAERGAISHAAVALGVSQPTVTRLVARVESGLGHRLFDRSVRGVVATDAGMTFVAAAREALRSIDDAVAQLRSEDAPLAGKACVAMPDTIGRTLFIPLIDRFARMHPDVELRVMATHPSNVPLALASGVADVGLISSAHDNSGVTAEPLALERLHLVSAADMPVGRRKRTVRVAELEGVPLVLPAIQPGLRTIIDAAFAQRQLLATVALEVDADDAIVELVRSGRARTIMSHAGVVDMVRNGDVVAQQIEDPTIDRLLSVATAAGRTRSRLVTAVAETLHTLASELATDAHWTVPAA